MIIINIPEIEETQCFEFVVANKRRITIDLNKHNLSVQIPGEVDPKSISNTEHSFFLRTNDSQKKHAI